MAATVALAAEFSFADDTTRTVIFEPFDPELALAEDFKANVKTFNSSMATDFPAFPSTFLSDDGASCTGIVAASVTTTEKTPIYAKSTDLLNRALRNEGENNDG